MAIDQLLQRLDVHLIHFLLPIADKMQATPSNPGSAKETSQYQLKLAVLRAFDFIAKAVHPSRLPAGREVRFSPS